MPIYIQEKIHPQALVEDLANGRRPATAEPELDLFADFDGLDVRQLVDFYQHDQHWTNRLILGDSLLVMTSLAEKEDLARQGAVIYVDPPYGIKFGTNWQVTTRKRDVKDGKDDDLTRQPEQIKAFRDTWELGIHSYLATCATAWPSPATCSPRAGSIFVQIGDENVHLVRCAAGRGVRSENFVSLITFTKTRRSSDGAKYLPGTVRLCALVRARIVER